LEIIAAIYIIAKAIREGINIFPLRLYTAYPIHIARGICINTGNTLAGNVINKLEITHANTALTIKDRKSTRLNSSHVSISYAVFCLKKKNKILRCPTRHKLP